MGRLCGGSGGKDEKAETALHDFEPKIQTTRTSRRVEAEPRADSSAKKKFLDIYRVEVFRKVKIF